MALSSVSRLGETHHSDRTLNSVLTRPGSTQPIVPVKGEYRVAECWKK